MVLVDITHDLKKFADSNFGDHFMVIFGSYAYNEQTSKSDLDMVCFIQEFHKELEEKFVGYYHDLCKRKGICLEGQFHHRYSLLISYENLISGINGNGFIKKLPSTIIIPERINKKFFFLSTTWKMRFAFNIICSKNIFVSGNSGLYESYKKIALQKLIGYIFLLNHQPLSINQLVEYTIYEQNSLRAEGMYLGFKDKKEIRAYLNEIYPPIIEDLLQQNKITRISSTHLKIQDSWTSEIMN